MVRVMLRRPEGRRRKRTRREMEEAERLEREAAAERGRSAVTSMSQSPVAQRHNENIQRIPAWVRNVFVYIMKSFILSSIST